MRLTERQDPGVTLFVSEKGSKVVHIGLIKPNPPVACERCANITETPRVPARDTRLQVGHTKAAICRRFHEAL